MGLENLKQRGKNSRKPFRVPKAKPVQTFRSGRDKHER